MFGGTEPIACANCNGTPWQVPRIALQLLMTAEAALSAAMHGLADKDQLEANEQRAFDVRAKACIRL